MDLGTRRRARFREFEAVNLARTILDDYQKLWSGLGAIADSSSINSAFGQNEKNIAEQGLSNDPTPRSRAFDLSIIDVGDSDTAFALDECHHFRAAGLIRFE